MAAGSQIRVVIAGDNQIGPAIVSAIADTEQLGAAAQRVGTEVAAMDAKFSMSEAKGTLALLGDELGVKLPRHVRTFVADLPGVGKALEAAFSVTAGLVLVDILIKAGEKVVAFYEALNVLSKSEQAANDAAIKQAKDKLDLAEKQLTAAYDIQIAEATGLDKDRLKLELATALVGLNKDYVNTLTTQRDKVQGIVDAEKAHAASVAATAQQTRQLGGETEKSAALASSFLELWSSKKAEGGQQYLDNLQKGLDEAQIALQHAMAKQIEVANQGVKAQQAADDQVSAAHKRMADEQYKLDVATAQNEYALGRISADQVVQITEDADARRYAADLQYSKDKKKVEDDYHLAALAAETKWADQMAAIRQQALAAITTPSTSGDIQDHTGIPELEEAYRQLGIKGTESFVAQTEAATKAYDTIRDSGVASYSDLLQAEMKLYEAEIARDKSLGQDTTDLQKALATDKQLYADFTGDVTQKTQNLQSIVGTVSRDFSTFFADITVGGPRAASAFANFGRSILQTIDAMIVKFIVAWTVEKALGWIAGSFGGSGATFQSTDIITPPTGSSGLLGTIPGHALGGSMQAGEMSWVGEQGPELFVPGVAGSVIPASQVGGVGGGTQQVNHFDLRGSSVTPQDISRAMVLAENRAVARAKYESRDMQLRRV